MSFPERGNYGNKNWRGNCSGYPILNLVKHFRPTIFCDPSEGSGTSRDVARKLAREGMKLEYFGFDLRTGFNLVRDSLVKMLPREADYIWYHPAYFSIIQYSGNVWGKEPHPDDLSRCGSYEEFLEKLQLSIFNIHEATRKNGNYSILIGDVRQNGNYYSIQSDIIKMCPGKLEGVIIKEQHNCVSDGRQYTGNIIRIAHEYILNFRRDGMVFSLLDATLEVSRRLKSLSDATWGALVQFALMKLDGEANLSDIYRVIEETAPDKTRTRPNWQAKVRQVLQFKHKNVERGRWALAA